MVTVTRRAGKLVALRIASPVTYREATTLRSRVESVLRGTGGSDAYLVADLSDARVYSPDAAEKIVGALMSAWPLVARMGVLVNPNSSLGGLIFQSFREAGDLDHQAWTRADGMVAHLDEVLPEAERSAMREFLRESVVRLRAAV